MMKSVRREVRWMLGRSIENRGMSKIVRVVRLRVVELSLLLLVFVRMRLRRR